MFLPDGDASKRGNDENLAWMTGASLTAVIVNSNQIFCASAGDSKCAMSTIRGSGKYQIQYCELSKDHKTGKFAQTDDKARIVKCGYKFDGERIISNPSQKKEDQHNGEEIIRHGGMLTRCIGDLRFKSNIKFGPDKQAVIAVPGIISTEEWNTDDWILIGSSGFWEIYKG